MSTRVMLGATPLSKITLRAVGDLYDAYQTLRRVSKAADSMVSGQAVGTEYDVVKTEFGLSSAADAQSFYTLLTDALNKIESAPVLGFLQRIDQG